MKKKTKFIYVIIILNLFYLIFDVCYFLFIRLNEEKNNVIYEFGYEANPIIFLRWILILVITFLFFYYIKNKSLIPIYIILFLSLAILTYFGYNYFIGNFYRGSFVYKIGLLEIVSILNIIYAVRALTKRKTID